MKPVIWSLCLSALQSDGRKACNIFIQYFSCQVILMYQSYRGFSGLCAVPLMSLPHTSSQNKRAFNQQSNEEPVVWLGFLPAWQSVLGRALTIDPPSLSACPSTHQPAGAPEAGGACETMWVLISFPQPDLRFFL